MGRLTLILGGARSGKSTFAQRLAEKYTGSVVFIATAQAGDAEMAMRIKAHKSERPSHWTTHEIPHGIAATWRIQCLTAELTILDCLTFLVSNLVLQAAPDLDAPDEEQAAILVGEEIESLIVLIQEASCNWIVVSNEVGMGLVPPYPLGRLYRDQLGWANQRLAATADEIYLLVAGIPVPIHRLT